MFLPLLRRKTRKQGRYKVFLKDNISKFIFSVKTPWQYRRLVLCCCGSQVLPCVLAIVGQSFMAALPPFPHLLRRGIPKRHSHLAASNRAQQNRRQPLRAKSEAQIQEDI